MSTHPVHRRQLEAATRRSPRRRSSPRACSARVAGLDGVDIAVCPSFTSLSACVDSSRGSGVAVYAQNMHQADSGAFTGEVSAPMLTELDVDGVVLGHSERRQLFGETDKNLAEKVPAARAAGLEVILCVGETEDERENGDTERRLRHQVQEGLDKFERTRLGEIVDRLRADLGHRHRPRRHARPGPGGDRLRPRARRRPRQGAGASARGSSTAAR